MKGRLHKDKDVKKLKIWKRAFFRRDFRSKIINILTSREILDPHFKLKNIWNIVRVINALTIASSMTFLCVWLKLHCKSSFLCTFDVHCIFSLNYLSESLKWKYFQRRESLNFITTTSLLITSIYFNFYPSLKTNENIHDSNIFGWP